MEIITVLILCVVAHFLADFSLQGDFLANGKRDNKYLLFAHSVIWAGLVSAPILMVCQEPGYFLLAFVLNAAIHYVVDGLKASGVFGEGWKAFYRDQAIHGLQIIGTAVLAYSGSSF